MSDPKPRRPNLLRWLFARRSRVVPPPPNAAMLAPLVQVLVAPLAGDPEGRLRQHLLQAMTGRAGLAIRAVEGVVALPEPYDGAQLVAAQINARHLLAEHDGDVLVIGGVDPVDGYGLRLATPSGEESPFAPANWLGLPAELGAPYGDLLHACLLAAAEPRSEPQRQLISGMLPGLAATVAPLAQKPPMALSPRAQQAVLVTFGHLCAALAAAGNGAEIYDRAADSYRAAMKRKAAGQPPLESPIIFRHLAAVLTAKAERTDDVQVLEDAAAAWRSAIDGIPRGQFPGEWAALNVRLGQVLYRLDLKTGDTNLLKEAIACYQAALQVFTRSTNAARWGEAMYALALALEVYGDQLKSAEVLERAVAACRVVLEVRTREKSGAAWAAAMNTLGSALFLLDKHGRGTDHLDEAMVTLQSAIDAYKALGALKPAAVAEKNLAHVMRLSKARRDRRVADPGWAEE